tara:strand:+ start:111 stop:356 length:246 start_codon:yes stop_codon:yes gene_type:complete
MIYLGVTIAFALVAWFIFEQIFSNFLGYYEGSALYTLNFILSGSTGFIASYFLLQFLPRKIEDDKDEAYRKGYNDGKKNND